MKEGDSLAYRRYGGAFSQDEDKGRYCNSPHSMSWLVSIGMFFKWSTWIDLRRVYLKTGFLRYVFCSWEGFFFNFSKNREIWVYFTILGNIATTFVCVAGFQGKLSSHRMIWVNM